MNLNAEFFLKVHWHVLVLCACIGFFASTMWSFVLLPQHVVVAQMQIIPLAPHEMSSEDFFKASLLARDYEKAIGTEDFMHEVFARNADIESEDFLNAMYPVQRWDRAVNVKYLLGENHLKIFIHAKSAGEAWAMASTIGNVLGEDFWKYSAQGIVAPQIVKMKEWGMGNALASILLHGCVGWCFGALAGVGFVFLRTRKIEKRHRFIHEEFLDS